MIITDKVKALKRGNEVWLKYYEYNWLMLDDNFDKDDFEILDTIYDANQYDIPVYLTKIKKEVTTV